MNLMAEIVDWTKKYAEENHKRFIRMDTVGGNTPLINYYRNVGLFSGIYKAWKTEGLPGHYHNAEVSLFEIDLSGTN